MRATKREKKFVPITMGEALVGRGNCHLEEKNLRENNLL